MRAVSFNVSVPGFLLAKSVGRVSDSAFYGAISGLRLREVALPELPGPEWARLRVLKAGICGTDIGNLTFSASPAAIPLSTRPTWYPG